MEYLKAREYFYGKKNHFMDLGLDNIKIFLKKINSPEEKLNIIQIAGTNGKGSVSVFLSNILIEAGYKVGRYNSPVVFFERENISINNENISENDFSNMVLYLREHMDIAEKEGRLPTIFELETIMAFAYFEREKCDIVILETGLGGLNDATNVSTKNILSIFSSISLDHMNMLGNTLSKIARIKAGIIKKGSRVVSAEQEDEVKEVILETALLNDEEIKFVDSSRIKLIKKNTYYQVFSYKDIDNLKTRLLGNYQQMNAAVAIEAVNTLNEIGYNITTEEKRRGIEKSYWPGRFEILGENPMFIIDGAHNIDAVKKLIYNINEYLKDYKITMIMGIFSDKDYESMIQEIIPYASNCITIKSENERALNQDILKAVIEKEAEKIEKKMNVYSEKTILEALKRSKDLSDNEAVLAFGSLSFLKEIKEKYMEVFLNEDRE